MLVFLTTDKKEVVLIDFQAMGEGAEQTLSPSAIVLENKLPGVKKREYKYTNDDHVVDTIYYFEGGAGEERLVKSIKEDDDIITTRHFQGDEKIEKQVETFKDPNSEIATITYNIEDKKKTTVYRDGRQTEKPYDVTFEGFMDTDARLDR